MPTLDAGAVGVAGPADALGVRCPSCRRSINVPVTQVVNAADSAAREALLAGRLNVTTCPGCGSSVRIAAPILYFDLAAEIALLWLPPGLDLPRLEQERFVGRLTNGVLERLPPEQRRMFLLQPRTFLSEERFFEAVLEANGLPAEELTRLRADAELLEELLGIPDPEPLRARLTDLGRDDDPRLLALAEALAADAAARGNEDRARRLTDLGARLADAIRVPTPSVDQLIDALLAAADEGTLRDAVVALRPALDYGFFVALTDRVEATPDGAAATRLAALRDQVLAIGDELDAREAAALLRAADSLDAILRASDPLLAARRRGPALDGAFLAALEQRLAAAQASDDADLAARLSAVRTAAVEALEATMPARRRLINQLVRAESPAARAALLDARPDLVDGVLVEEVRSAVSNARRIGALAMTATLTAVLGEVKQRLDDSRDERS